MGLDIVSYEAVAPARAFRGTGINPDWFRQEPFSTASERPAGARRCRAILRVALARPPIRPSRNISMVPIAYNARTQPLIGPGLGSRNLWITSAQLRHHQTAAGGFRGFFRLASCPNGLVPKGEPLPRHDGGFAPRRLTGPSPASVTCAKNEERIGTSFRQFHFSPMRIAPMRRPPRRPARCTKTNSAPDGRGCFWQRYALGAGQLVFASLSESSRPGIPRKNHWSFPPPRITSEHVGMTRLRLRNQCVVSLD